MEVNLLSKLVVTVPLLSAPVALIWGLRRMLIAVFAICALILVAPYIFFGIWALFDPSTSPGEAMATVSITLRAFVYILGWMVMWSLIYGAGAAAIRAGWLCWRRETT